MRRILVFCLFAGLVSGCAHAPRQAGVLRLATDSDPSTLDPALSYDTTSISYVRVLYRGLVDYDDKARLIPALADRYSVSPDGKTYTFHLRPGVRFHDKTPVTAEDFRYGLERVLDPTTRSDGFSIFSGIEGAKAYGEQREKLTNAIRQAEQDGNMGEAKPLRQERLNLHPSGLQVRGTDTLIARLSGPDTTFLNYLALPFGYAVPRDWVEKLEVQGKTLSENPNGNGPFRFIEWTHDARLRLVKNTDYFDPTLPKSDRLELAIGNSAPLQMMRFEQGRDEALTLTDAYPPDFLRLSRDPQWKPHLVHSPMLDVRYLCLNNEKWPFTDKRVRQALNYAIDKQRIVAFRAGRAVAAKGVLPPGMPGYNPNLQAYEHNPQKARELLKQAGFKNDRPVVLYYAVRSDAWYEKAAVSIQNDLRAVGMTISLKGVTYPELKAAAGQRKNIQMSIIGWIADFVDPSNFLDVLLNGDKITDSASNNRAFYSNPQVNALLKRAGLEADHAKRLKMYQDAEQQVVRDAPWVPLNHSERFVLRQAWVKGYNLNPAWAARYEYVGVQGE